MMRQNIGIYRGKTKDGKWLEGYLLISGGISQIWIEDGDRGCNNYVVIPDTVGEFTGQYDKNGKKIFEGDIVEYAGDYYEVIFEDRNGTAYFGILVDMCETWPFGYSAPSNKMVIKRNIYDT